MLVVANTLPTDVGEPVRARRPREHRLLIATGHQIEADLKLLRIEPFHCIGAYGIAAATVGTARMLRSRARYMTAKRQLPPRLPPPRAIPKAAESGTRPLSRSKPRSLPQRKGPQPDPVPSSDSLIHDSWFPIDDELLLEPAPAAAPAPSPATRVLSVDDDELERLARDTRRRRRSRLLVAAAFPIVIGGVLLSLSSSPAIDEPLRPVLETATLAGDSVRANLERERQQLEDLDKELERDRRLKEERDKQALETKLRRRAAQKRR